jgi:predicted nucleotidyltransferase
MVQRDAILGLARRIAAEFSPEKIILFGSYATGTPSPDSDVDLLVILPFKERPLWKSLEILNRTNPSFPVDLIARTASETRRRYRQGDPLVREALDRGKVLYERRR